MRPFLALLSIVLIAFCLLPAAAFGQDGNRTEDYAFISVWQQLGKTFISTTIDSTPAPKTKLEPIRSENYYDFAPVVQEMERLNALGFELVTMTTASTPDMLNRLSGGYILQTFVFKRKVDR